MHSYADFLPSGFQTFFKRSLALPRFAILGIVIIVAVVVGPRGLAVGPSQTRSMTPALPTGAAMESQNVLSSIPLSFDLMQVSPRLERHHASYPETTIGPISFPEGAIDVPWTPATVAPRDDRAIDYANTRIAGPAGNTVSGPIRNTPARNNVPALLSASNRAANNASNNQAAATLASLRATAPANGPMANGDWRSVVIFDRTGSDLSGEAVSALNDIAGGLRDTNARIQLLAFGGDTAERSHSARRLALRRALAVRNYLMQAGVDQEQISVRALGGATDGGPASRVDVIIPTR